MYLKITKAAYAGALKTKQLRFNQKIPTYVITWQTLGQIKGKTKPNKCHTKYMVWSL